jgi:hypothetical protein
MEGTDKKGLIISALILIVTLSIPTILINAGTNQPNPNTQNTFQESKPSVLGDINEDLISTDEPVETSTNEEEQATETPDPQNQNVNNTNAQTPSNTVQKATVPSCKPTLNAVILRSPYTSAEAASLLGELATQITGSYKGTCINPNEVSYEWFARGYLNATAQPYVRFSTAAKPNLTNLAYNIPYDIIFRVSGKGLSSEVKTWMVVDAPYVEPVKNPRPVSFPVSYTFSN